MFILVSRCRVSVLSIFALFTTGLFYLLFHAGQAAINIGTNFLQWKDIITTDKATITNKINNTGSKNVTAINFHIKVATNNAFTIMITVASRRKTFVGGKCALPSVLLVMYFNAHNRR